MYAPSAMFWYRVIFMAELLIAESVIVYRLKPRSHIVLRLIGAVLCCFGFSFAIPVVADNAVWSSVMYLLMFLCTVAALKFCFRERWITIVFYAVAAYTLQHIAYQMFDFLTLLMGFNYVGNNAYGGMADFILYGSGLSFISGNPFTILVYLFVYGLIYFFGYLFIKSRLKDGKEFVVDHLKMFVIAVIILFFDAVISSVITYYSRQDFNRVYVLLLDLFNLFCCFFALYLQFDVDRREKLKKDLVIIDRLWKERERQYGLSKENIELINQKCHDLRHQIRRIGDCSSLDADVVREIEDVISIYDTPVRTGNEALDIILTEKSLICNRNEIKLCCIVDGKKLNFMSSADLYALFGNILDNAIEAVSSLETGKKTISLSVKETNAFLVVNMHNYYDKELTFEGSIPRTTKSDTSVHGYGMKSVLLLCEKYRGVLSIKAENKVFNLNIVFPTHGLRPQNDG